MPHACSFVRHYTKLSKEISCYKLFWSLSYRSLLLQSNWFSQSKPCVRLKIDRIMKVDWKVHMMMSYLLLMTFWLIGSNHCNTNERLPSWLGLSNTTTASLLRRKTAPSECPGYDTKQSDGEVPAMLELWGMQSTSSLRAYA